MIRRQFVAKGLTVGIVSTAGCISDLTGDSNNSGSDLTQLDVELEFKVEGGDLVVYHNGGDPIPQGETVYVTIDGNIRNETQLDSEALAGSEIIRVEGADTDNSGNSIIGLYFDGNDRSIEIGTGEVHFSTPPQPPAFSYSFDYNPDENTVAVQHVGGSAVESDEFIITGDADNTPIESSVDGQVSVGEVLFTHQDIRGVESGDTITLVWVSGERTVELGTFEAP